MVITTPNPTALHSTRLNDLPNEIIDEILLNLKSITQDKDFIEEFGRLRLTNLKFDNRIRDEKDFSLRATKNMFLNIAKEYKKQIEEEGVTPETAESSLKENIGTVLKKFQHICLPINDIVKIGDCNAKEIILNAVSSQENLKTLILKEPFEKPFSDKTSTFSAIKKIINDYKSCEVPLSIALDCSSGTVNSHQIKYLCDQLANTNISLTSFKISGADVDDKSLNKLAHVPGISELKELSLMNMEEIDSGLKDLYRALTAKNKKLEEISIYGQFDPSSLEDLINLLHNKKIKMLRYGHSSWGNEHATKLFNALKGNQSIDITTLEIGWLSCRNQSEQALEQLIESRPRIKYITMDTLSDSLIEISLETQVKILKHNFPQTLFNPLEIKNMIQEQDFKKTSETLKRSVSVASAHIA